MQVSDFLKVFQIIYWIIIIIIIILAINLMYLWLWCTLFLPHLMCFKIVPNNLTAYNFLSFLCFFFSSDFLPQNHSYKVLECSFSCTPAFWSVSGMLLLIRLLFSSICRNWQYFQLLSIMVRNTTSLSFLLPFAFSQVNVLNHWLDLCAHNNISRHEA